MTRRHVAVTLHPELWARAGGVAYRNLGVEDSGDPLPDWVFTQSVELVLDAEERMRTFSRWSVCCLYCATDGQVVRLSCHATAPDGSLLESPSECV